MRYVIGDTHFNHHNIIGYCNRPFNTIDEMNEHMITEWNKIVQPTDIVYHLGDFGFFRNVEDILHIRKQLKGNIFLCKGNHDRKAIVNKGGFSDLQLAYVLKYKDIKFFLSHYPMMEWEGDALIHGHIHNNYLTDMPLAFNVSVEVTDYKPVPLDDIVVKVKEYYETNDKGFVPPPNVQLHRAL